MNNLKFSFFIVCGWLFSRVGLSLLRINLKDAFFLLPGFYLAAIFMFLVTARIIHQKGFEKTIAFLIGVISDAAFYWIVRPRMGAPYHISGPWDSLVLSGSAIFLLVVLSLVWMMKALPPPESKQFSSLNHLFVYFVLIMFVAVILTFRVSYEMTTHLPNEARSLFIRGFEIHHANWGILGMTVTGIMTVFTNVKKQVLLFGACLFASFFFDQFTYLQFSIVTDTSYGSFISLMGPILMGSLYIIFIKYLSGNP